MSGSARKRREKSRQCVRRVASREKKRARLHALAAAAKFTVEELAQLHEWLGYSGNADVRIGVDFGVERRDPTPPRGTVRIGDRDLPTEVLNVSRPS